MKRYDQLTKDELNNLKVDLEKEIALLKKVGYESWQAM